MICSIHFNDKLSLTDGYDDSLTDSDWVKWFVVFVNSNGGRRNVLNFV